MEWIFLRLPSVQLAIERVAQRVAHSGHDIPEATIRRRFEAGLRLSSRVYQPLVDEWTVYDNAGAAPLLVERSSRR